MAYVHPTFLYESLWNLLGFILINVFWKKKKFYGEVGLWYVTWYGFGRMLIEGLRTDSLYVGNIRISQLVGFVCFVVGLGLIVGIRIKLCKQPQNTVCETSEAVITENTVDKNSDSTEVTEENNMSEEKENKNGEDN